MNVRTPRIPDILVLPDGLVLEEVDPNSFLPTNRVIKADNILNTENIESYPYAIKLQTSTDIQNMPDIFKDITWRKISNLIVEKQRLKIIPGDEKLSIQNEPNRATASDFITFISEIDKFIEETNWLIISNRQSFLYYQFASAALGITVAISLTPIASIGLGLYLLSAALGALCGAGAAQLLARKNSYACCGLFKPPQELSDLAEKLKENIPTSKDATTTQRKPI